ncbi:uncharacterized protein BT62DRAFT_1037154 [Guyanagaster necrorhizus]|uniref:Uncharacterized protein n=1 Tax=Guyanagaster necrorhizus TaxID=856835 RepID=A0A9P7VKK0_9AGAR|nr:uncharacterized protein BT62DRAFT_1037154 [Guyanagaster necrorhizus MCA 3950]KAG7442419.1 hypothetical protein BT62DRAFT_1037154 [Guyanagaster necrorhizus MCA 3950]
MILYLTIWFEKLLRTEVTFEGVIRWFVGTCLFISACILASFGTIHTIFDDRESSLSVLRYVILRHTQNSLSPAGLYYKLMVWFKDCLVDAEGDSGGNGKIDLLNRYSSMPSFAVQGLKEFLWELVDVFVVRYKREPTTKQIQTYEACKVSNSDLAPELPAGEYSTKQEKLDNPAWLIGTLEAMGHQMRCFSKQTKASVRVPL